MSYTAANIRVLSDADVAKRFEWAEIGSLSAKHGVSEHWVRRGFAACQLAGVDESYFVDRYLEKLDVAEHEGVTEAFKTLFWPNRWDQA